MNRRLDQLRRLSRPLEPDARQRAAWNHTYLRHVKSFAQSLPSEPAFRYLPRNGDAHQFNARLLRALQRDGRILLTSTSIASQFWLRWLSCAPPPIESILTWHSNSSRQQSGRASGAEGIA